MGDGGGGGGSVPEERADRVQESGQQYAHLYVFTAEKGGMAGCDTKLQQQVIFELSKGSKHFEHATQQDAKLDQRIAAMQEALRRVPPQQQAALGRQAEQLAAAAEAQRDLSRWCCVVDMDMFYAAVELRDQPHLAERPVAVGGTGMISTSNYVARRYGVRSAMPGFIAQELCRRQGVELVLVRPNFEKYTAEAERIREVLGEFGPFDSHSLDEASVDLTDAVRGRAAAMASAVALQGADASRGGAELSGGDLVPPDAAIEEAAASAVLQDMREKIREKTGGLTASAGLAPNFALAKMAADEKKPNGQFLVPRSKDKLLEWLHRKPVRKIGGVGKVMEKMLRALGVEVVGDVFRVQRDLLVAFPGQKSEWLISRALGIAHTNLHLPHDEGEDVVRRKSISNERTFRDESDPAALVATLRELCKGLGEDMAKEGLAGKTATLKLKRSTFEVVTRAHSSTRWLTTADDIFEIAQELLKREMPCCLRLMGVCISAFRKAAGPADDDRAQAKLRRFFGRRARGLEPRLADGLAPEAAQEVLRDASAAADESGQCPMGALVAAFRAAERHSQGQQLAGRDGAAEPLAAGRRQTWDPGLWEVPCIDLSDDEDDEGITPEKDDDGTTPEKNVDAKRRRTAADGGSGGGGSCGGVERRLISDYLKPQASSAAAPRSKREEFGPIVVDLC